jgi:hypothetical protein
VKVTPDRVEQCLHECMKKLSLLHISLLCEPAIYLVLALVLRAGFGFSGTVDFEDMPPALHQMTQLFLVLLVPIFILAVVALRRLLFSSESLLSAGAEAEAVCSRYMRAQVIVDALAAAPAMLAFVSFLLDGRLMLLVAFVVVSTILLALLFPREDVLHEIVTRPPEGGKAVVS